MFRMTRGFIATKKNFKIRPTDGTLQQIFSDGIVAGSSTHGEVSVREIACRTGIPYTTVWIALRRTLLCYPYKIQHHHELLPGNFVKLRSFAGHFKRWRKMTIGCLTHCGPTKPISPRICQLPQLQNMDY